MMEPSSVAPIGWERFIAEEWLIFVAGFLKKRRLISTNDSEEWSNGFKIGLYGSKKLR